MSIILQPRDRDLLAGLLRFGVLSSVQICLWYFNKVAKTTVLRRIRLLEKGHYLKRGVTLENGTNTWNLSFKGRELLSAGTTAHFSNRNSIKHDVLLTDIRRKLESFGLAKDITPEFELKSEVFRNFRYGSAKEQLIPDALMFEQVQGAAWVISLELELSVKAEKRYEKIFRQYGLKNSITRIWYFGNSRKEIDRILKFAQKHWPGLYKRMWFSVIEEFIEAEVPLVWIGNQTKWVKLREIQFDNFKMPNLEIKSLALAHTTTHGVSSQVEAKSINADTTKPLDLQPNSLIPTSLREGPPTPDPSPPTNGGKGSGVGGQEEIGMSEFRDGSELKECG